jgi:2-haloacid dehalogenase
MSTFKPKFISFDCYGTLIDFQMAPAARRVYGARLSKEKMDAFCFSFAAYRLDEVLAPFKPFEQVVRNSVERTCKSVGVAFESEDAQRIIDEIPTWTPHPDTVAGLRRAADKVPLVILSNSMNNLLPGHVAKLEVPFHAAYTAEQAGHYKPHMKAFEFMFDSLGCPPEDIMHVSSSFRYDLMTARDLRMGARVLVDRGHEPDCSGYATHRIKDIGGLADLV